MQRITMPCLQVRVRRNIHHRLWTHGAKTHRGARCRFREESAVSVYSCMLISVYAVTCALTVCVCAAGRGGAKTSTILRRNHRRDVLQSSSTTCYFMCKSGGGMCCTGAGLDGSRIRSHGYVHVLQIRVARPLTCQEHPSQSRTRTLKHPAWQFAYLLPLRHP
jgi:hypothetical protein